MSLPMEWISGDIKPSLPGFYERISTLFSKGIAYWDGTRWYLTMANRNGAARAYKKRLPSRDQKRKWKHLA